ncbi:MAG: NAD(P)-dependent alcohol dehydrogenase, partial [Chitinophagaceae bacterium]|nr:NAD(P)-dependent alcohol dehydrogenase [Chitinophagaceae bacterium]
SIAETREVLDFCAKNHIAPDVEMISIQDINHAFKRMEKEDVRYRFVIDMASIKKEQG